MMTQLDWASPNYRREIDPIDSVHNGPRTSLITNTPVIFESLHHVHSIKICGLEMLNSMINFFVRLKHFWLLAMLLLESIQ